MRWTLTLLMLNLVAITWIVYTHSGEDIEVKTTRIFPMDTVDVTHISIQSAEAGLIQLEKRGQAWWLTNPIEWLANPFAVQRILNQILFIERDIAFSFEDLKTSGKTLADYGLEKPALTIMLKSNRTESTLKVGSVTGIGSKLYALEPQAEQISVLVRESLEGLALDVNSLRSDRIFDIPIYLIESVVLKMRDPDITLRLALQKGNWVFESPIITQADDERVKAFLNLLSSLKVSKFTQATDKTVVSANFDTPDMRLTLRGKNVSQTLLLSGSAPVSENGIRYHYARMEHAPAVFTVVGDPFEVISKRWDRLREHRIINMDTNNVSAIEIRRNEKKLTLQQLETGPWQIISEKTNKEMENFPADSESILGLLNHINLLEALTFVSDAPSQGDLQTFGLDPAKGEINIRSGKTNTKLTIGELSPDRSMRYVASSQTQSVYGVAESAIGLIVAESYPYRTLTLFNLPEAATIRSVRFESIADKKDWLDTTVKNERTETMTKLSAELKKHLRFFKAKAFIDADATVKELKIKDEPGTRAWGYFLDVVFDLPGGDKPQSKTFRFFLTDIQDDKHLLASFEGMGQPFIVQDETKNLLKQIISLK